MARASLRGRAHGTSAGSSGPALTRWGSFGATGGELDEIEEMVRQDGANQAKLTMQLAEMGLKMYAMLTRPREWFGDAEWRTEYVEQMREPMAQYSRVNERLLDGCEDAYLGVAEEFCAAEPNFEALVASGAMAPQLAALLQAAATEARTAGQRATVDVSRVNGEVLFVDSMSGSPHGFVATVIFRSKEARSQVPHHPASAHHTAAASAHHTAAANSAAAAEASADARAAVHAVTDADAGADAAADDGDTDAEYVERRQLWTFTGEHPPLRPYLKWIKGMMSGEGGDDIEPPVVWTLHDIDFAVAPYEQPELPPNAGTMVQHMSLQLGALVTMLVLSAFIVAEAATKQRRPPPPASFNRRERHAGSRADDEGDAAYERERERGGSARDGARGGGARGGARGGTQHEVA
eukprot:scaffold22034_cov61-Phaeocystis_antarctica.AAC.1